MKRKSLKALLAVALLGFATFLLTAKQKDELTTFQELLLLEVPRKVSVGQVVRIRTLLLQRNGRPLQVQPIVFSASGGQFISDFLGYTFGEVTLAYTNNEGEAYIEWQAPLTSGTFTLQAHYLGPEGQAVFREAYIEVLETPPQQILVNYAPARMVLGASEDEFVSLSIHLIDQQGNPIAGETVNLRTNLGHFRVEKVKPVPVEMERWVEEEEGTTSVFIPKMETVIQDMPIVTYSQEVNLVTNDHGSVWVALYPPDQSGVATITISTSHQTITTFYVFTTVEGLHLTSDSFCAVDNEGAQIIARLYDASGRPISGQTVTFQTTLGQLSSSQAITDENGEAVVTLFGSGTEGTAIVTASALGYTDKIYVDIFRQFGSNKLPLPSFRLVNLQPFSSQPYCIVTITLNRSEVRPLGTGIPNTVTVSALVRDHQGHPVSILLGASAIGSYSAGHNHNSSRPVGTFSPPQGSSDSRGRWQTEYTAPVVSGREEIIVSVRASIPQQPGHGQVRVRVPNLGYMPIGSNYRLVGQTRTHPANHYATSTVQRALINIANTFASRFRGQIGYQL